MARKPKYTAALIGTGRIGFSLGFDRKREQPASHTMALLKNRRIKLVAACDNNEPRLEHFKRYNPKVTLFADYNYLFATTKVDIVVIAVNEFSHLDAALTAIKSKPRLIILEKPVALTVAQALKIQKAAEENGVAILVNHERRFAEDYKMAKNYLKVIGDVVSVNARLDSGLRVYSYESEAKGEYSLLHDGTHLVDVVKYLLEDEDVDNNAEEVDKFYDCALNCMVMDAKEKDVVREVSVHYKSAACQDINFTINGKSRFFGFEIDIVGSEGRIRIGNGIFECYIRQESSLYTGFYSLDFDRRIHPVAKTRYFSNMVKNAVDFLDGKQPLRSTVQNGINTLRVLEEIKNKIKLELLK